MHESLPSVDPIEGSDLPMSSPLSPSVDARSVDAVAIRLPPPCPHLAAYRSTWSSHPLRSFHRCLRVRPLGRAEVRRDPGEVHRCAACSSAISSRLYACLACAIVHCPTHAHAHARIGHEIAVDVHRAELFCCACGDQIYDRDFDAAVVLAQAAAAPVLGRLESSVVDEGARKRRRIGYRPWYPDSIEDAMIWRGSSSIFGNEDNVFSSAGSRLPWGLRGLNNLGNTCFLNSVLQTLLHTPLLRNYFLSHRHNRFLCQQGRIKQHESADEQVSSALCLSCDLDAMYSAVFSGDRRPYSPAKFLYSWWQHASHLASYDQQDAHDFFITMLDGIREKEHEQLKPHSEGSGDCCIVHKVFSGILRSDVTCTICGYTSTTYDPCMDISLDLDHSNESLKISNSSSHVCNGGSDYFVLTQKCGMSTLLGCLEHFTRPERLGSDQKLFCQHCQVKQDSLKQLSIRKLPLVSCFHIKRFEHSLQRNMARKIDRYVQFPFYLDMSPFLSSSIIRSRFGNRFSIHDVDTDADMELASEFEIFAVITHSGKLESGHYTTYLRRNNQWYKCDDSWITHVSENTVRASQAYMLFYIQKILH